MSSHYTFVALCAMVLFAVVVNVSGEENIAEKRELFSDLTKDAIELLAREFIGATKTCLREALSKCQLSILFPPRLIQCAGEFIMENKGICLVENIIN